MRNFLVPVLIPFFIAACTGNTTTPPAAATTDTSAAQPAVALPFTAEYSSNFVPGKQADVATVLNNYKAWETGDIKAFRATLGDSVMVDFPDGGVVNTSGDSAARMVSKYRDSLSSVKLTFYAWTSNHSVDKNQDWVNVWYKEVDIYKKGNRVDSIAYEDDNLLKNGKIVYVSSHEQKFPKKK